MIGVLSILISGGVYCPLTPEEPPARLQFLVDESRSSCVLVHTNTVDLLPNSRALNIVPTIMEAFNNHSNCSDSLTILSLPQIQDTSLAIIIFTSGSTGKPKGIQMSHRNFINSLAGVEYEQLLIKHDTVLQRTPVTFDMHLQDIIGSAMLGACLVLLPPGADRDLDYIIQACEVHQISCLSTVPTVWTAFIEYKTVLKCKLSTLRILLSSGKLNKLIFYIINRSSLSSMSNIEDFEDRSKILSEET